MRSFDSRPFLLAATVLVCGVAACGGSVSPENAGKIRVGMTEEQVIKILGEPSSKDQMGPQTFMKFESADFEVVVGFRDGKVEGTMSGAKGEE